MTYDVFVQYIDFKTGKVAEAVTKNEDGSYTVFLNSRLNQERLCEAYLHALKHINNCDFASNCSADQIEAFSHCTE